jgi:hypothetical protein
MQVVHITDIVENLEEKWRVWHILSVMNKACSKWLRILQIIMLVFHKQAQQTLYCKVFSSFVKNYGIWTNSTI